VEIGTYSMEPEDCGETLLRGCLKHPLQGNLLYRK
jgi:hypothetical protein